VLVTGLGDSYAGDSMVSVSGAFLCKSEAHERFFLFIYIKGGGKCAEIAN